MVASKKAAVLPVPVCAWPATSRFAKACGNVPAWMGVQWVKPASSSPRSRAGVKPSEAKVASDRCLFSISCVAYMIYPPDRRGQRYLQLKKYLFSMIALTLANIATEYEVRVTGIKQDEGQQKQGADQQEEQRAIVGGRIPDGDRRRGRIGPETDAKANIP